MDDTHALAKSLNAEYPGGDVGVLSVYFLNHVTLKPGEAIFMAPDTPHAYLSGDLIECMTCSDNVIRGGLTPKFKDIPVLLDSLSYIPTIPQPLTPVFSSGPCTTWRPTSEFGVTRLSLGLEGKAEWKSKTTGIAIVVEGSGRVGELKINRGQSVIIPAGDAVTISTDIGLEIYIADSS